MNLPPIQFGKAQLKIDEDGLDYFKNDGKKYLKYKKVHARLREMAEKSQKQLDRFSDNTEIEINSMSYYRRTDYSGTKDYYLQNARVKITVQDVARGTTITRKLERKNKAEPLRVFWMRALRTVKSMEALLDPPSQRGSKARELEGSSTYTFKELPAKGDKA